MVVRLSDIRSGKKEEKKSGVVRLSDIRETKRESTMIQEPSKSFDQPGKKTDVYGFMANQTKDMVDRTNKTAAESAKAEDLKAAETKRKYDELPRWRQIGYDIVNSPIGKTLMNGNEKTDTFLRGAVDTASLGFSRKADELTNNLAQKLGDSPESIGDIQERRDESRRTKTYKVGQFAGYLVPGTLADRAVVKIGGEALRRLPKVVQGLVRGSASGALDTAAQEGGDVAFRDGQFDPLNVAIGAGAGGVIGAAFPLIGSGARKIIDKYFKGAKANGSQAPEILALPEPRQRGNINTAETPNVIHQPETGPRGLPQPNKRFANDFLGAEDAKAGILQMDDELRSINIRYQEAINDQYKLLKEQLKTRGGVEQGNVVRDASGEVVDRFGRMSNNPQWYRDFYAQNGKVPSNKELYELAKRHVDDGYQDEGAFIPSWKVENQFDETVSAIDQVKRTLGESTNVQTQLGVPNVAVGERVGRAPSIDAQSPRTRPNAEDVGGAPIRPRVDVTPTQPVRLSDLRSGAQRPASGPSDELGFAQTVRNSENTADNLTDALRDQPMVGARTSDILNRQQAEKLIEHHGMEGLYSKLMGKTKQFSSSETTAAQILAKRYSSMGGDDNLSKAIDLVSKTAKGGREMGQAIQALSQWNKLDAEGALLLGEKQLNRGVEDTANWQKLTTAQGRAITEPTERIGSAQETRSLADEVLNIVTNKQTGEALTEAEKATIKQFQDQVKLINEKGKGILPKPKVNKASETIREVSQIEPKTRTRDQVVNFLDAKAEKARQRLAASRNKLSSTPLDTYADYAIIGASKIAKGVVKLSDFTEQMVKDFGERIRPHINQVYTKATNIFRKENGLPTVEELDRVVRNAVKNERFSPEEAAQFKAWASEIGHMSDDFKIEATQDLQSAMKELGESTLGQKIATIQTGAQLLNAVTIGRNILGNAALISVEKVNKVAAVPIDWALSKITGERTIQWLPKTQEKMFRNFMSGTESGWDGVSPTGTLDSYGIHPNVFGKKNPLKYITKSLGASMQGFDFAAYRVAYGDVLATYGEQLGKAQGLTKAEIKSQMPKLIEKLDARIHEMADEAGRYATFQDDTLLSQGAEMLKRGLNKITDLPAQKLVEKGLPKKYSTEGFGLGDLIFKYAKTPANLIMRAIDYSPIGFLRATMELAPLVVNKSKFNQFKATRALSRAITGTLGLTGTGYILADAGILTGSSSLDRDTRSIQEQSGQGAYKVNWSALGRFLTSGFDYDAAKYQKGDHLMDYQWLQPAAISVAMGVNANKAIKAKKDGADVTGWQIAQQSLLGGLQTVLENPMVQGISNVVDASSEIIKRQDTTKLKGIIKGAPASFVPTLLNQWRAATDNNQRETFSKNIFTEMGNMMKNKVPGLSKTLPVSYDSLGNARQRIQGGKENTVSQYLTAFFSPARMTEYQVSPEAKLVLDLMNESGSATVLPRIGDKSFHVRQGKDMKDLKVSLTAEQFSKYQQNLGTMVSKKLTKQSEYLSNPNISLENKVKRVTDILTDMGKKAREDIGTEMGYKKKDIKG